MKTRIKPRELLFMILPIALLCGVGWWRSRVGFTETPPENVMRGKPRVVVGQWRELEPSAFDVYRGYERKLEVALWSAGQLPAPTARKGALSLKVSREISSQYPSPDVVYKSQGHWKKLTWTFENPSVLLEFEPRSERLGERIPITMLVRLPDETKRADVRLRGRFSLQVYDREDSKMASGGIYSDITASHDLVSPVIEHKINLTQTATPIMRVTPLHLKSLVRKNNSFEPKLTLEIQATCDDNSLLNSPGMIRLDRGRILDAKGREVAKCDAYRPSIGDDTITVTPTFEGKIPKNASPLIFQGALSLNGCWPIEINVVVPSTFDVNARPSSLPFQPRPR